MKPIYFPFTYLPGDVMEALGLFFSQVVMYQPSDLPIPEEMAPWVQSGRLAVRIPIDAGSDKLAQAVEAYHVWASHHQGSELAFFKTSQGTIPFYDESSVHHIRSEIRHEQKKAVQAGQPSEGDRLLMQARLFLHMAQAFDAEHWAIHHSLNSQVAMERDMLKNLQGDSEDPDAQVAAETNAISGRPGDYMLAERLAAWGSLMQCDPELDGILVTDNREVLASLLDDKPEIVEVGRWERATPSSSEDAPGWQRHFAQYLVRLATEAWPIAWPDLLAPPPPGSTAGAAALTLYLAVAQGPRELLATGVSTCVADGRETLPAAVCRNTVIALITPGG